MPFERWLYAWRVRRGRPARAAPVLADPTSLLFDVAPFDAATMAAGGRKSLPPAEAVQVRRRWFGDAGRHRVTDHACDVREEEEACESGASASRNSRGT